MIDPPLVRFLITLSLFILLILDLINSATRSSFNSANLARLLGQRELQQTQVNRTLALINNQARVQAGLHLFQAIYRFFIAGLILLLFAPQQNGPLPVWPAAAGLLLAALILFFLEWIVEQFVAHNPEDWAIRTSTYAAGLKFIAAPFLALPMLIYRETNGEQDSSVMVTEDELMNLVEAGQQEGVLEQGERRMIVSIFRLGDTLAREIMVPRIDLLALELSTPLPEAVNALLQSGYSRVPVFKESVDNIMGLLYAKDLLKIWHEGSQIDSLKELLRPAYFVPETKKVDELLAEMQAQRIHMGIVVDEYGGVAGLVTLEDIVEEIVGEILDEYDQAEEMIYQRIDDSEFLFQGRVDLDDFNEIMDSELPREEADTLGGFIYSRIGRVPTGGESLQVDNLQLTVEQVSGRRIRKVRVHRPSPMLAKEEDNPDVE